MELLYYISGILSVGVLYGVILLRNVKSSHTDLLARLESQLNISSLREADRLGKIEDLNYLVMDIQKKMEKDQYESVSGINKRIKELDTIVYDILDKVKFASGANDKNFSNVFSEIQQIKQNFKALSQDNFIR